MIVPGVALSLAGPAFAQPGQAASPAPACAAMDTSLPAGFAEWNGKAGLATATSAEHPPHAALALGKGYDVSLLNTPKVFFPVQPEKPSGRLAHAGLFEFTVGTGGASTVALSKPAWIDVLKDGKYLEPASFGHGPECTSTRKMVVFHMKPGKHAPQVSGNAAPALKLMVTKKP